MINNISAKVTSFTFIFLLRRIKYFKYVFFSWKAGKNMLAFVIVPDELGVLCTAN